MKMDVLLHWLRIVNVMEYPQVDRPKAVAIERLRRDCSEFDEGFSWLTDDKE